MPRKVKVVNINDDSTYGDVAEAIVENGKAENEPSEETETEELGEPDPPKPKARAKRVPKSTAVVDDTLIIDVLCCLKKKTNIFLYVQILFYITHCLY